MTIRNYCLNAMLLLCCIVYVSCSKLQAVHCTPNYSNGSRLYLVGYDSSEVSLIEIIRYAKGDGFKTPLDTFRYIPRYSDSAGYRANDRQFDSTLAFLGVGLFAGSDYKVIAGPSMREWSVTEIEFADMVQYKRPSSAYPFDCGIGSYTVDGKNFHDNVFKLPR